MRQVIEQYKIDNLAEIILSYLGVNIFSECRKRKYVNARMIYYKVLHNNRYGWSAISKTVKKNHATIIHGVRQFDDLIMFDKKLLDDYRLIKDVYGEGEISNSTTFMTRTELINETYSLDKQNKSLNLSIEELNHSLTYYQKYRHLIKVIDDRGLCEEKIRIVTTKLNRILNGLYN